MIMHSHAKSAMIGKSTKIGKSAMVGKSAIKTHVLGKDSMLTSPILVWFSCGFRDLYSHSLNLIRNSKAQTQKPDNVELLKKTIKWILCIMYIPGRTFLGKRRYFSGIVA